MGNGFGRMIKELFYSVDEQLNICLRNAIREGNLEKVKSYIKQGADIDSRYDNGMTPLHLAAEKGCTKIVEYLVEQGAKINIRDNNGRSPKNLADEKDHQQIAEYLASRSPPVTDGDEPSASKKISASRRPPVTDGHEPQANRNWKAILFIILVLLIFGWWLFYGAHTPWSLPGRDNSMDSDRPPSEEL